MPVYKAPAMAAWSWQGLYLGGQAGWMGGRVVTGRNFNDPLGGEPEPLSGGQAADSFGGGIFGVQAGYNWVHRLLVAGIEGDIQGPGRRAQGSAFCPGDVCNPGLAPLDAPVAVSFDHGLSWFGTLRGRLGTAITPNLLPYVTAGVAFGEVKTSGTLTGFDGIGNAYSAPLSHSVAKGGWTVGGGLEGHLGGNWTAKAEYLYMDFGFLSVAPAVPAGATVAATINPRLTSSIVRAGLNYKLN